MWFVEESGTTVIYSHSFFCIWKAHDVIPREHVCLDVHISIALQIPMIIVQETYFALTMTECSRLSVFINSFVGMNANHHGGYIFDAAGIFRTGRSLREVQGKPARATISTTESR